MKWKVTSISTVNRLLCMINCRYQSSHQHQPKLYYLCFLEPDTKAGEDILVRIFVSGNREIPHIFTISITKSWKSQRREERPGEKGRAAERPDVIARLVEEERERVDGTEDETERRINRGRAGAQIKVFEGARAWQAANSREEAGRECVDWLYVILKSLTLVRVQYLAVRSGSSYTPFLDDILTVASCYVSCSFLRSVDSFFDLEARRGTLV